MYESSNETVLYNTNNFYENCGVKNAIGNNQTFNKIPIEQTIELFEKLLEKQKKIESLIDDLYKTLNFVYNNYFPKEVVDELISSKNKEIDWLKIEIKDLKQERLNSSYKCNTDLFHWEQLFRHCIITLNIR